MGMFDDITYEAPCPICGVPLTGWQSKSGGCGLQNLTPAQLWQQKDDPYYDDEADVPGVDFYTGCGKCGTWVEIRLAPALLDLTEDDHAAMLRREPFERRRGPIIPAEEPVGDESPVGDHLDGGAS